MSSEKCRTEIIIERLDFLVNELAGGNRAKFCRSAGISQPTFHKYMAGRMPSLEAACQIHTAYGVDINWFLTGEGNPFIEPQDEKGGESDTPAINSEILAIIIRVLEKNLDDFNRYLPPDKKAQVVTHLYEYYLATQTEVNESKVADFLRLVS